MTKKEAAVIFKTINDVWNVKFDDTKARVYYENLSDLEFNRCYQTVQKLIQTSEYMPTIATIRKAYVNLDGQCLDEITAYSILKKAISDFGIYGRDKAIDYIKAQSEVLYEWTQKMGWRELCMCPEATLTAYFNKTYTAFSKEKMNSKVISQQLADKLTAIRAQIQQTGFALLGENYG